MDWDILGHEWAVRLLEDHIAHNRVRHAYLFTGPDGVGRRTLALRLAQAVNCLTPPTAGQYCGNCRPCTLIAKRQHPDVSIIEREIDRSELRINLIREIQHTLSLTPYEANYRFVLVLRFEQANAEASNALLKTLEEPNPKVILALTAESTESILPTIASRCDVIRLNPLPLETLEKGLQDHWNVPEAQARLLAHLSGGRPGYAIQLFQNPDLLKSWQDWRQDHWDLLRNGRVKRFSYADKMTKDLAKDKEKKNEIRQQLLVWLSLWREVLLFKAGEITSFKIPDEADQLKHLAAGLDLQTVRQVTSSIEKTISLLDHNANARLAVEVLMLDLPTLS